MTSSFKGQSESRSVRGPVLLGLFTGTAVGTGYLLAGVPNVELITLISVLAGAALGYAGGMACGIFSAMIFSMGNPYGIPAPLLLAAQAAGMGLAGAMGQLVAQRMVRLLNEQRKFLGIITAGGTGLIATLFYDGLTTLAIIGAFDLEPKVVFLGAIPFFLIHAGFNIVIFAVLFPLLLPRLLGLARSPLVGRTSRATVLLLLGMGLLAGSVSAQDLATAEADSSINDSLSPYQEIELPHPSGWKRPIWSPFLGTMIEELNHRSSFIPVVDGGLGAPVLLLKEAGTTSLPLFVRDGIPLGTGHSLADDPWLVPLQGLSPRYSFSPNDGWGGTGGRIDLDSADLAPKKAYSMYRGRKGPHETYMRGISLLSPKAEWRLSFDFEESLDNEGYNYTELPEEIFRSAIPFPGHAKIRTSHTSFSRLLNEHSRLTFHYHTGRKTRDSLPSWGAEHQEIWDTASGVRAEGRSGLWTWGSSLFWNDRDVQWGDRLAFGGSGGEMRLLETAREGGSFDLDRSWGEVAMGLGGNFQNWEVHDSGASWLADGSGYHSGNGQQSVFDCSLGLPLGSLRVDSGLGGNWDSRCGLIPTYKVQVGTGEDIPFLAMSLEKGGRTPRCDEWLTPVSRIIGDQALFLLPNSQLKRENSLLARFSVFKRVLGLDFALVGGWTNLRDGITWISHEDDPTTGTWENELELENQSLNASAVRQGSFLGWYTVRLEGTWQDFQEKEGLAPFLAPEQFQRLHLTWENHFFEEDGILQLALLSTRRTAMPDPWDVSRQTTLPAVALHDLVVGFRLAGAHLSLAFRNLASNQVRLSSGALSPGRERDMRLFWIFHH